MHINNVVYHLTPTEQFGFTPPVAQKMSEWNHSEDNPILGAVASRIVGLVVIPFSEIVDAFAHLGIGSLKGVIGILVFPYNSLVFIISSEKGVRTDLELSSALIHLWRVIECLFGAAIFPFICLLDPDAAFRCMRYRLPVQERLQEEEIIALTREIGDLNTRSARLSLELTQANQALERAQNNARELPQVDRESIRLLEEKGNLVEALQSQLNNIKDELSSKDERIVLLQQELERAKTNLLEKDQLELRYSALHRDVEEDQQRIFELHEKLKTANQLKEDSEAKILIKEKMIESLTSQIDASNEKNLREIENLNAKISQLSLKCSEKQTSENQTRIKLEENSKQDDLLKVECEKKNNQIQELQTLQKKDEEEKQRLKKEIQSLNDQKATFTFDFEKKLLQLNQQISQNAAQVEEKTKLVQEKELKLTELAKEHIRIEASLKNLQEKSKQHDQLKVEFEEKNNQIQELRTLNNKIEEEKIHLAATIDSLKNEIVESASKNESVVSTMEKQIEELKKEVQFHKKLHPDFEKLKEKALQFDWLASENKILKVYREQNEEELKKLRDENNELRAGVDEKGNIIRSPSKGGF